MMMWVRDEEAFIQTNLAYHHAAGVERAYVYLDQCTDRTEDIVRGFPWAEAIPWQRPAGFEREHTVTQNQCADHALQLARTEGFDWLMHVDADELAFGGNPSESVEGGRISRLLTEASLPRMLADVAEDTEAVSMRTKEAAPLKMPRTADFWRNTMFQVDQPLQRQMLDPVANAMITVNRFLGHAFGKSIVRTQADVQACTSHIWTRNQYIASPELPANIPIPTEHRGWHYHYIIVTTEQWRAKYRKLAGFSRRWPNGRVIAFPKGPWIEASLRLSEAEAAAYLDEWVFLSPDTAAKYAEQGRLRQEVKVRDLIESLQLHH